MSHWPQLMIRLTADRLRQHQCQPDGVNRSSGSATGLPAIVTVVSFIALAPSAAPGPALDLPWPSPAGAETSGQTGSVKGLRRAAGREDALNAQGSGTGKGAARRVRLSRVSGKGSSRP